jgi:hypothetical protein
MTVKRTGLLLAAVALAIVSSGCDALAQLEQAASTPPTPAAAQPVAAGNELADPRPSPRPPSGPPGELARPRIAEPDVARPRYVRDDWQAHGWADADGDGCNTREEVLIAQSRTPVATGAGCKILAGEWLDPFTGRTSTVASQLEIDHLVALADAHRSGGWAWPPERKVAFVNDLDSPELHAVWGAENQAKADDGPDGWLPPNQAWRCTYVAAYADVKARWDLTVTSAQWEAVERVWLGCGPAVMAAPPLAGAPGR